MAFTDHVCRSVPQTDPRLGAMGTSGGYMANWLIGHTRRLRAAVSSCSISKAVTDCTCSDIPFYLEPSIGGTPWDGFETLWRCSPVRFADQVETPILFTMCEQDYRCCIDQTQQMFFALKRRGVDTRLVSFKNAEHLMSIMGRPNQRIRYLREARDWLDRYLKN